MMVVIKTNHLTRYYLFYINIVNGIILEILFAIEILITNGEAAVEKYIEIAKENEYHWVAVDENGEIFAYQREPVIPDGWDVYGAKDIAYTYIGKYTGSKKWTQTLREVK